MKKSNELDGDFANQVNQILEVTINVPYNKLNILLQKEQENFEFRNSIRPSMDFFRNIHDSIAVNKLLYYKESGNEEIKEQA